MHESYHVPELQQHCLQCFTWWMSIGPTMFEDDFFYRWQWLLHMSLKLGLFIWWYKIFADLTFSSSMWTLKCGLAAMPLPSFTYCKVPKTYVTATSSVPLLWPHVVNWRRSWYTTTYYPKWTLRVQPLRCVMSKHFIKCLYGGYEVGSSSATPCIPTSLQPLSFKLKGGILIWMSAISLVSFENSTTLYGVW